MKVRDLCCIDDPFNDYSEAVCLIPRHLNLMSELKGYSQNSNTLASDISRINPYYLSYGQSIPYEIIHAASSHMDDYFTDSHVRDTLKAYVLMYPTHRMFSQSRIIPYNPEGKLFDECDTSCVSISDIFGVASPSFIITPYEEWAAEYYGSRLSVIESVIFHCQIKASVRGIPIEDTTLVDFGVGRNTQLLASGGLFLPREWEAEKALASSYLERIFIKNIVKPATQGHKPTLAKL